MHDEKAPPTIDPLSSPRLTELLTRVLARYGNTDASEWPATASGSLIHKSASVSPKAVVHRAVVGPAATIGADAVVEYDAVVDGLVGSFAYVGRGVHVDCGAEVHGIVDSYAVVGPAAVVGVYARIGSGARLAPEAVVGVNAVVGASAYVGRRACIAASACVGDHAEVGDGAQLDSGARVAAGTLVLAGAVFHESPMSVVTPDWPIYHAGPRQIGIGCTVHPIEYWRTEWKQIAEAHGCDKQTIAMYHACFELIAARDAEVFPDAAAPADAESGEG